MYARLYVYPCLDLYLYLYLTIHIYTYIYIYIYMYIYLRIYLLIYMIFRYGCSYLHQAYNDLKRLLVATWRLRVMVHGSVTVIATRSDGSKPSQGTIGLCVEVGPSYKHPLGALFGKGSLTPGSWFQYRRVLQIITRKHPTQATEHSWPRGHS